MGSAANDRADQHDQGNHCEEEACYSPLQAGGRVARTSKIYVCVHEGRGENITALRFVKV
jgi:hypothetical protein